jgi:co-chaperonin GroES (HSP10)
MQEFVMNKVQFGFDSLEEAFPNVDPGVRPFGSRVLCQIRLSKNKTKGGLILTQDSQETERWNTQVAKVIDIGALAFKNRNTQEPWPEGAWSKVGDFVRVPKYGGDKWSVKTDDDQEVIFVILNDLDLVGEITGDPLAFKAYI